ncbi:MAG TPA: TlpA disulfide reductase family protein [Gemmatimonadales bacterium]|nr:TlpA disulfide reductase family protein [Gemmatimonadales bacterium]
MTNQKQWTLVLGIAMTVVFGVALGMKVRPQLNLIGAGSTIPDFHVTNVRTRSPISLADYHDKVLLVNVWATWCDPCRLEMPSMEKLSQHLAGTDFRVVAISVDKDGPEVVMKFVNELGLHFDILQDRTGDIQTTLQTTGVPESYVVDRHGTIIKKVIGAEQWDAPVNENLIRRLLDAR